MAGKCNVLFYSFMFAGKRSSVWNIECMEYYAVLCSTEGFKWTLSEMLSLNCKHVFKLIQMHTDGVFFPLKIPTVPLAYYKWQCKQCYDQKDKTPLQNVDMDKYDIKVANFSICWYQFNEGRLASKDSPCSLVKFSVIRTLCSQEYEALFLYTFCLDNVH